MVHLTCPNCGYKPLYFFLTEEVVYRGVPELEETRARVEAYLADCRNVIFELQCFACFWHTEVEIIDWRQEGDCEVLIFEPPSKLLPKLP